MTSTFSDDRQVSVIIATYRRPDTILRAINTALAQTFPNLEVIVVTERDDNETMKALASIKNDRVRVLTSPVKNGPGPARDYGVLNSSASWIAFLDDDDEWEPTKIEKQLKAVTIESPAICMTLSKVISAARTVVRPTKPYGEIEPLDEWLCDRKSWFKTSESMLQTSSLFVPRALFDKVQFTHSRHEEWELAIRAVNQYGYRLLTVEEVLVTHYSANAYSWRASIDWINSMRSLVTKRSYSGFCLTVATQQGIPSDERQEAMTALLATARKFGSPTAKQLFAFGLIRLIPDELRHRIRALISGRQRLAQTN